MLPFPSGTMSAQKEERLKPCSTVGKVDSQSGDSQQPSFAGKSTVNLQHSCKPLLAPHLHLTISYSSYPTPWSNFPFFLVAVSTRLLSLLVSSCGMPRRLCQLQTQLLRLFGLDGALTALGHVLRLDAHDACAGTGEEPKSRGKADLKSEKSKNLGIVSKVGNNQQLPYFHGCWLDFVP